jgi:hypothetical protein
VEAQDPRRTLVRRRPPLDEPATYVSDPPLAMEGTDALYAAREDLGRLRGALADPSESFCISRCELVVSIGLCITKPRPIAEANRVW